MISDYECNIVRKLSALYGAVVAAAIMVTLFSLATIVIIIKCVSWKPEVYVSNQFIEKTPEQLPLRSKFLLLDPVWCYLYCRHISTISVPEQSHFSTFMYDSNNYKILKQGSVVRKMNRAIFSKFLNMFSNW